MATTIPVYVADDVAARVDELGMRAEYEQMLEHVKQAVPGLQFIRVTLEYDPVRPEDDPQVIIWARRDDATVEPSTAAVNWELAGWMGNDFPPEVCIQFTVMACHGVADGW
jgi:hypothetical protein